MTVDDIKYALKSMGCDFGIQELFSTQSIGLGNGDVNSAGVKIVNLTQLDVHGGIEHDSSLTRSDVGLGDSVKLNTTLLEQFKSFGKTHPGYITFKELADYRKAREADSRARNPNYTFGPKQQFTAFGEAALLYIALSDEIGIRIDWMEYLFVNEKFPFDLGWRIRPISTVEVLVKAGLLKGSTLEWPF
ncbi:hypothetical protein HDU76_000365 [Blyttiomyces sp. JEL0837]|nr:hypothetical protein HDU76_000365 [Blyttiomyces sp. JEL0837]